MAEQTKADNVALLHAAIPADLKCWLKAEAARQGRTMTEIFVEAAENYRATVEATPIIPIPGSVQSFRKVMAHMSGAIAEINKIEDTIAAQEKYGQGEKP